MGLIKIEILSGSKQGEIMTKEERFALPLIRAGKARQIKSAKTKVKEDKTPTMTKKDKNLDITTDSVK